MRIVMVFAAPFQEWPKAIIREMQKQDNTIEVIGIALTTRVYKALRQKSNIEFLALHDLESLEREWLKNKPDVEKLTFYEEKFGTQIILNTIIADRHLGSGWVDGAVPIESNLQSSTVNNDTLKSYVTGLFDFLCHLYEKQSPDCCFIYVIASGAAYAMAEIGRHFSCPVVRLQHSRIGESYIMDTSTEGMLEPVQSLYHKTQEEGAISKNERRAAKQWLEDFRRQKNALPSYTVANDKRLARSEKWPAILKKTSRSLLRAGYYAATNKKLALRAHSAMQEIKQSLSIPLQRRYARKPSFCEQFAKYRETSYVYYALHVNPEASTMVMAPRYCNQLAAIEALSKSIPLSMTVLVKEHPLMIGRRPSGFYKRIHRMPNVVMIDPDHNSHDIIQHAALVATITGTVGWEALLLKRPVLLLGQAPYMVLEQGFIHCSDWGRIHEIVNRALNLAPADDEILINYIAAVFTEAIEFPATMLWENPTAEKLEDYKEATGAIARKLYQLALCGDGKEALPNSLKSQKAVV